MRITRRTISLMVGASLVLAGMAEEAAAFLRAGGATSGSSSSPLTQAAFTITNWNSSGNSPGMIRIGMPFKSGDVPAGSVVTIYNGSTQIAAQFDQLSYYPAADPHPGSLMFAVCTIRDDANSGVFNASESRTYTPHVVSGGSWNNTGTLTLSNITSNHQFQVQCTNVGYLNTTWASNGTVPANTFICGPNISANNNKGVATIQSTTAGGTSQASQPTWNTTVGNTTTDGTVTWTNVNATANTQTYNGGTLTIDFNSILTATTSGQATRLTKVHSGPVCETWMAWGMAVNGSSVADAHLKGYVYVTMWKNLAGSVVDYEFGCTVSQDWWSTASKFCLTYNASLVDVKTSTTYLTYTNIVHPYLSQWFTGRNAGDNNDCRRFWVNQIPTLGYQPNQTYWASTGPVPPFNTTTPITTYSANLYSATTYTPCVNLNVNAFIDNTGGSNGRGIFMDTDARAFLSQNQTDVKIARISAMSGLHVSYHSRSNDNRIRTQDGGVADTGSCPMTLNLGTSSFPTFTGMPTPVDAYRGGTSSSTWNDSYAAPLGGTGVWIVSLASSHASSFCYFMYLLEGERHFLECLMDMAQNSLQQQQATGSTPAAGVTVPIYYNFPAYKTAFSIPTTLTHGVSAVFVPGNTRSMGWAMMLLTIAAGIVPPNDALGNATPEEPYFDSLLATATAYMAKGVNTPYMPASELAAGWWVDSGDGGGTQSIASAWMQDIGVIGTSFAVIMTSDANAKTMANFVSQQTIARTNSVIYRTWPEKNLVIPTSGSVWASGTNEFLLGSQTYLDLGTTNISVAGGGSANVTVTNQTGIMNPHAIAVNDTLYWSNKSEAVTNCPVPVEVTIGTLYYVVSATNSGANQIITISTSMGGSAVTFASAVSGCQCFALCAAYSTTPANSTVGVPLNDSYPAIARTALAFAKKAGVSGASASLATMQTFIAPTDSNLVNNVGAQYFGWYMNY